ncbi:MAG TPA: protein translocase subunit SecD [Candidatus Ornithomonoglobus intestinigallinarum]|uniref:Protein translocase subunit SecD n=1 Tax=Candidatus Ornithomonoglobus intestinigallinarum TaxID=2840894 RepID=A0A9D1H2U3_9FIRM|nr:protein translocase subunit SecD [Candidatus Ornithomonoglobus intestinigallinarum]
MKKKSIVTLFIVLVAAVLLNVVAFRGFNIAGFTYGGVFDEEKGIRKGIDLAGGSVITFQADAENPTEDEMNVVESIFNQRMTNAGYTEARISKTDDGKITVEIPSVTDTDEAASLLGEVAKLTFRDAQGNVVLDGATDIVDATYQYGRTSETSAAQSYVQVQFSPDAREKFAEATKAAAAATDGTNYISIYMDDDVISSPMVSEEINSETCVITGDFTPEEAQDLANKIKSGALPFNLNVISQETVGAELGTNALPTSLLAAGIGVILVMLFMMIMYRVPGVMASLSLLIYVGLIALIMGIFRINLSLSGIAGIVLSIGMAVDADCIIFERIKEEMRLGKTIKASVDAGFTKAFSAILDSNVTTIISCVVLYISGIGAVTGFATTLGIGVILSMFTAIVITKFLMKQLVNIGIRNRKLFCSEKKKGGTVNA